MDDFILRALLGSLGVALVAGPLGCFIVWQRMAYFGEALSHTALLGVALGLLLGVSVNVTVILVCAVMALLFLLLQKKSQGVHYLSTDSILGILAHAALALSLVLLAFKSDLQFDLYAYLFGDVLAIGTNDLYWILAVVVLVALSLLFLWRQLLSITINPELAQVEGVPVLRVRLIYMLLMAVVVAIAMKIVGVLLVISLLIIPASTVRPLSKTPEAMAMLACLLGCLAAVGGLSASIVWDLPAGPAMVLVLVVAFTLVQLMPLKR